MPLDDEQRGKDEKIDEKIESSKKNNRLKMVAVEFVALIVLLVLFTYFGK